MRNSEASMMIGACEIACHYPELTLKDAVGDVRQLSEMIREYGMEDPQKEEIVFNTAYRFITFDRELAPKEAIQKALCLWKTFQEYKEVEYGFEREPTICSN